MESSMKFKDSLYDNFSFSADLNLAVAGSVGDLLDQSRILSKSVDGIHVSDGPNAGVHFPALATAQLLLENDIDPILQISCRDKDRLTLEIEIRGALALGVTSVLLVRGESAGISGTSDRIVKVSTTELIQMARRIEEGAEQANLSVGTIATVFKPATDWQPQALLKKTHAGANFIRTQLCFDADKLKLYMPNLVRAKVTWKAPIIVNLAVLPSAKAAKWLSENLRGSLIPKTVIKRMEQADDPEAEGVQVAAELMAEFDTIPGISGVCLMTPGLPELIPEAVNASGLRQG
ncbi:uncharacterized protein METZ01_LOCUS71924 [marine metagenome]|uniref:Uncharacterized protein n=1 Tax=marine metagenome TaxID=408172 RepID=A0A381TSS2_9ZZZZ